MFVHDTPSELKFVADGWGVNRQEVMYNDFVVVGPKADPAGVAGITDTVASFRRIAEARAPFITRGDDSGTHKAELRFWADAGIDPKAASATGGKSGYTDIGGGMGPALQHGRVYRRIHLGRPRHLAQLPQPPGPRHRRAGRQAAVQPIRRHPGQPGPPPVREGRPWARLYGLARVADGQGTIASYKVDGEQLFFPNAGKPDS